MQKIGISKPNKSLERYLDWLNYFNVAYEILDWNKKEDLTKINDCKGLILTGGVDIYPEIYCDWETDKERGNFIPERDGFELKLLEQAIEKNLPVLGICRGCQLINVYFKGNLIYDIESIRNVNHNKISEEEPRMHEVNIYEGTILKNIIGLENGIVTSTHHQSVDRVGEGLAVNAKSSDGIVEGIEYLNKSSNHFLLGIQWHPEKFSDFNNPFSKNILYKFVEETLKS